MALTLEQMEEWLIKNSVYYAIMAAVRSETKVKRWYLIDGDYVQVTFKRLSGRRRPGKGAQSGKKTKATSSLRRAGSSQKRRLPK